MEPTIGRIVHYVAHGSADGAYPMVCRAAVVTALGRGHGEVSLGVLNPTGFFFKEGLGFDPGVEVDGPAFGEQFECAGLSFAPGSWHWPASLELNNELATEPPAPCKPECAGWSNDPESRCRTCPLDRAA